ncbi:MAG: proline dehydrogenase family protein [Armatimonadetes bacterium]|nr:proline dehydrogenase family protein [Armatimonadota bacterium]
MPEKDSTTGHMSLCAGCKIALPDSKGRRTMLFRSLILKASGLGWVKKLVTRSRLFRPMIKRFIAGETLTDAFQVAEALAGGCMNVSLDLLGENVATEIEAERATAAYIEVVEKIAQSEFKDKINISIKLTMLGLDQGDAVAESNFRRLLTAAKPHGIFVRADMEASAYTERTIAMIERVYGQFPNTGTVLQSYLHRTQEDVERLIRLGCRVRIVKGAYLEPEAVAFQDKEVVDAEYLKAAKRLMEAGNYPAIATHDAGIIQKLKDYAELQKIPKERFEWQFLYGIRRDLQDQLRDEGYNVRIYVPYGAQWYPYFSRRLAERPANMLFIAKSLVRK